MIVTPNNIMFDPHKSDPLVIENGCEEYGLICPMEEVVSIALYNDISHMKLKMHCHRKKCSFLNLL